MSGHHDFNELIKDFTPERRARVNKEKEEPGGYRFEISTGR